MFFPTAEDIKNKFKNLRTTFQRQYKMVKASKVCGSNDVFVPQWKHYQQLMFLQGCWDLDDCADVQPLSPPIVQQEDSRPVLPSPGLIISFLPTPSTSSPSSTSPCVPSNMMVKCYWTDERERALIAFYSGNTKHNDDLDSYNDGTFVSQLMGVVVVCCCAQSTAVCGTRSLKTTTTVS